MNACVQIGSLRWIDSHNNKTGCQALLTETLSEPKREKEREKRSDYKSLILSHLEFLYVLALPLVSALQSSLFEIPDRTFHKISAWKFVVRCFLAK